jgi:hypothetical protein
MHLDNWIVVDCESLAPADVDRWIEAGSAPSNYKDPDKIAAYIEEDRRKRMDKAATDVDLAQVLCVAAYCGSVPGAVVDVLESWNANAEIVNEDATIGTALSYLATPAVIGFNVAFDMPLLLRRAQLLGLPVGDLPRFEYSKYRPSSLVWPVSGQRTDVIDIAQVLSFYGAIPGKSLDWYCRRFECPITDEYSGSQVAALWEAGDYEAIVEHATKDVQRTAWLAQRLGIVAGVPESVAA